MLDGWISSGANGSSLTRPDSICARMSLSESSTQATYRFGYDVVAAVGQAARSRGRSAAFVGPRGCSSMAEHQLPKLTVRVRFPSPAPCDLSRHRNGLNPQWVKSACPALVRQGRFETHVGGLRPPGRGQVA